MHGGRTGMIFNTTGLFNGELFQQGHQIRAVNPKLSSGLSAVAITIT
jgi:hypothetical protein